MYSEIISKIKKYRKIIIQRHKNPDLDAYGSQFGLLHSIKDTYKDKEVYVVGDENKFGFLGKMDIIDDSVFEGALVIILDVAVKDLVSDERFLKAKEVIIIDHHKNNTNIEGYFIWKSDYIACAEIITEIIKESELKITKEAATALYGGITTDSGRFKYKGVSERTFRLATYLVENGADIQFIYNSLYVDDINLIKLKGYFLNNFNLTKNKVAYMKNDSTIKDKYEVDTFTISRGMVNQMAGIKGVPIWANFTFDDDEKIIYAELRSSNIKIVNIAKKYGGGGHDLACGCYLKSWEEVSLILNDLDQLVEGVSYV